jgi:hypothetical protein
VIRKLLACLLLVSGCSGYAVLTANVPPPPVIVVQQPEPVLVTGGVYYVQNAPEDVFFVSGSYYCWHSGYWYRSRLVSGPYVHCNDAPAPVYNVPRERWKNGPPPGHQQGHGNGHGHGHSSW